LLEAGRALFKLPIHRRLTSRPLAACGHRPFPVAQFARPLLPTRDSKSTVREDCVPGLAAVGWFCIAPRKAAIERLRLVKTVHRALHTLRSAKQRCEIRAARGHIRAPSCKKIKKVYTQAPEGDRAASRKAHAEGNHLTRPEAAMSIWGHAATGLTPANCMISKSASAVSCSSPGR